MFTEHPSGRIEAVQKKELPSAHGLSLRLLDSGHSILGTMTLTEALRHVEPASHLAHWKEDTYRIIPLRIPDKTELFGCETRGLTQRKKVFKRKGRGKELYLSTTPDPMLLSTILSKAYTFLLRGARVEFHLRQKTDRKLEDMTVDWALENRLHLRPDSILAAMPKGSTMLACPCTVSTEKLPSLMWAVEHKPSLLGGGDATSRAIKQLGTWSPGPAPEAD
ncbi:hypothetical protein MMC28_004591 [Mycoblastus sanguinarius]|nr:hypothetical protein [Mycoblastus sanguinarius]